MDKTYCIFGDSVTQGAYVKIGWVDLFRQYLEEKYKNNFINVFGLGVGGNTVQDILKRFENEALARKPDAIIFAVGINDTKSFSSIEFSLNLEKSITLAKKFTSDITFVGLVIGDWKGDEPFNQEKTTNFNGILKEISESSGCKFIQMQPVLKPEDFMDGLHPNERGHQKMFEIIKKYY